MPRPKILPSRLAELFERAADLQVSLILAFDATDGTFTVDLVPTTKATSSSTEPQSFDDTYVDAMLHFDRIARSN